MLETVISFGVFVLIFGAIYKVLPDAIIEWRDAVIGASLTALLFVVGKYAIGLYLQRSNVGGPYGPAGEHRGAAGLGLLLGPDPVAWRGVDRSGGRGARHAN